MSTYLTSTSRSCFVFCLDGNVICVFWGAASIFVEFEKKEEADLAVQRSEQFTHDGELISVSTPIFVILRKV